MSAFLGTGPFEPAATLRSPVTDSNYWAYHGYKRTAVVNRKKPYERVVFDHASMTAQGHDIHGDAITGSRVKYDVSVKALKQAEGEQPFVNEVSSGYH